MITKQAQIDGTMYHIFPKCQNALVYTYYGKAEDATPEKGIEIQAKNGEALFAMDTGDVYMWDAEASNWIKL